MTNQKIKQVFSLIKQHDADSLISISPINRSWLIRNSVADFALILYKNNKAHVLVDERNIASIKKNNLELSTHLYKDIDSWFNFCKSQDLHKTLFETNGVTHEEYLKFLKPLSTHLIPIDANDLRIIKTADELKKLQKSSDIICEAIEHLKKWIKIGASEKEAADELRRFVIAKGATGLSFPTIVSFGENSADIHGAPSDRKLKKNEIILVDAGCVYNGYCSDITRVWCIGKLPPVAQKMYDVVLKSNQEGIKHIKANVHGIKIDTICRNVIKKQWNGYDIPHGVGHGVGILIHENPCNNKIYDKPLPANSLVTIEPGIYDKKIGGIRIEDLVIVTKTGCKVLTHKSPKTIKV